MTFDKAKLRNAAYLGSWSSTDGYDISWMAYIYIHLALASLLANLSTRFDVPSIIVYGFALGMFTTARS
jgi:hypothetical protein